MNEKKEFSDRLRTAMKARRLEISAAVLEREFNANWLGTPVRRQTAWKWLNGQAIPTQDKLQELAKWLQLDPQHLRFGDHVQNHVAAEKRAWEQAAGYAETETFRAFLRLPLAQRKLVREIILTLVKALPPEEVE